MAKILVSLDEKLLARVDKAARALGLNRSAYLSRLVAREVEASYGPGRGRDARRALRRIDDLFTNNKRRDEDSTAVIRRERDSH